MSIFELNDFEKDLPVKNIVHLDLAIPNMGKYQVDFRVRLTDRPNLYVVAPKSGPILVDEYVYIGADDGSFYCLRADDGAKVWEYRVLFGAEGKFIHSSPVVHGSHVMFGAYDGNLYCLNRFTGKREWVLSDADWIGSSPCVNERDGVVYVGLEFALPGKRGGVAAVDIETGKPRWGNYSFPGLAHASPAYSAKHSLVVCGSNDHVFYAMDAKTGKIVWQFETTGEVKYGAVFDDTRDLVIFGSMDGGVYALHVQDGTLYHRFDARFGFYSTPALVGSRIIIGSLDKLVYCFNLETKSTVWTYETMGRIFASPVVDRGSLFIGSNDGRLYDIDVNSGEMIAAVQFTERIVNRVQVSRKLDGRRILYVPTHACELYRLSERG